MIKTHKCQRPRYNVQKKKKGIIQTDGGFHCWVTLDFPDSVLFRWTPRDVSPAYVESLWS